MSFATACAVPVFLANTRAAQATLTVKSVQLDFSRIQVLRHAVLACQALINQVTQLPARTALLTASVSTAVQDAFVSLATPHIVLTVQNSTGRAC